MKTQTIEPEALAKLARAKHEFSVSAQPDDLGWVVCVHDMQGDRLLLDLESKAAAVFDALEAVEQRLRALGIEQFDIKQMEKEEGYDEWLIGEVQEALDDPSPLVPHEEAMRRIRAAIKAK
ncbi:hypothetical protein GTP45_19820 [Pseudoduganella sp. FT55W]|uniref:Stability determinant domain-containing protein n=1 Tax=Duganella rivi TaxID=2666083 RepID=A0A7X4KDC6_9BURK|nr:hypothetical protein [Duganella rivi]MYM69070.1 hypothetical protein [Duganella rivi]